MKPLAVDLFCGLGGWTDGLLEEGYEVVGFDIERHEYWLPEPGPDGDGAKGTGAVAKRGITQGCAVSLGLEGANAKPRTRLVRYPAQLVLQDVLTLHGSQFKDVALIVASPPCQAYSYRAMPWKRAKALPPPDNSLFDACFRIQREAMEASGRFIPMVVENVRGAQKWVGRARWHYGSFYLWGDVPALMPFAKVRAKVPGLDWSKHGQPGYTEGPGRCFRDSAIKNNGGSWFNIGSPGQKVTNSNPVHAYGGGFGWDGSEMRRGNSKSPARKAASAMIAKIPLRLSRHIARCWWPQ